MKQTAEAEGVYAALCVNGQQIRLVIAPCPDGWLVAVVYPQSSESISLCELPSIEDAKAKAEVGCGLPTAWSTASNGCPACPSPVRDARR
jgi:hypothetical protein